MSRPTWTLHSVLAESITDYVAHKRALQRKYASEERSLRLLDRYLTQQAVSRVDAVTPDVIDAFLQGRRRRARSYNVLLGVLRCFFDWLVQQGRLPTSPVVQRPRRCTDSRLPFLFDASQARQLLQAAAALPDRPRAPLRGPTYNTIFALLYALGLRVGEVSRLRWADVDWDRQVLEIRHSKFDKCRLVPFGPRLGERLRAYRHDCQHAGHDTEATAPVFSFTQGRPVLPETVSQTFHRLVSELHLPVPAGVRPPRAHDLRHSYAVGMLRRWYQAGLDPAARLLQLSTFLGHVAPSSTAVYLTLTDDLLREAAQRFSRCVPSAIGRVEP